MTALREALIAQLGREVDRAAMAFYRSLRDGDPDQAHENFQAAYRRYRAALAAS